MKHPFQFTELKQFLIEYEACKEEYKQSLTKDSGNKPCG